MLIREILSFLLPTLIAGIIHHFIIIKNNYLSFAAVPIDMGAKLSGKPLLGRKKTWRGILTMTVLTSVFTPFIFVLFAPSVLLNHFISGAVIGLFYALGELPNSFLKRRFDIPESTCGKGKIGALFKIIDHFDSVTAASLSLFIVYSPSVELIVYLIATGAGLHYVLDIILHKRGYKKLIK